MKIHSWNVNGLRAVVKKNFLSYLQQYQPDILCLQETKLQPDQVPAEVTALTGYSQFWNSAQRKGYSGVAMFSKTPPQRVSYSMGVDEFDAEGRTIIAHWPEFSLIGCYFPNGQKNQERLEYKLRFYNRMLELMQEFTQKGRPLLVCGDYNTAHHPIDLARPKENEQTSGFLPIERAWLDKLVEHDYIDTFREFNKEPEQYSWWTYRAGARERNVGWRIDYFWANQAAQKLVKNAFILQDVMGSDHCPLGVELNV